MTRKRISDEILGERAKMKWRDSWTERQVRDRIDRYKSGNNDSRVAELIERLKRRRQER
jgi:hypothetical protein